MIGLEYVENRGAAFGLGDGFGWVFVLLAFVMVVASMAYLSRATLVSRFEVVGLGWCAEVRWEMRSTVSPRAL